MNIVVVLDLGWSHLNFPPGHVSKKHKTCHNLKIILCQWVSISEHISYL